MLHVHDDDLASCVGCGLCLPHCPTFRITGEERYSPRGRIEAMRQVHIGAKPVEASFVDMMDTCVQCRGCETACPSGVPFGRLMEGTRSTLAGGAVPGYQPWWRRIGYRMLSAHRAVVVGSRLLAVGQRVRLVPSRRLGLPDRLPLRERPLEPSGSDVWLYTGCVMDAWQRDVHRAALRVLRAAGVGVSLPRPVRGGGCCGALATHAGLLDVARVQAEATMRAFPGDAPILVDSAGCGAQLKDLGHLLGTPEAERFAARVVDIDEWLARHVDRLAPLARHDRIRRRVAVQDPCHLRHVQKVHLSVRTLLAPFVDLVELDDDGLCCGAGGAYAVLQPELAGDIRERKVAAVGRSGVSLVASANPGCSLHLSAAGLDVCHPVQLVDEAIHGGRA
ncbi:MAG: 4Fe-4S dicluster domain-containing protein [Actinobacteria bacterium]|nr:4Fe-4S dicluster domain-containing protein [Actinomycetota bacterium]